MFLNTWINNVYLTGKNPRVGCILHKIMKKLGSNIISKMGGSQLTGNATAIKMVTSHCVFLNCYFSQK